MHRPPFRLPRRNFLGLGLAAGASAFAPGAGSAATAAPRRGRAKNVLIVFEQGGLSHMDTWDPKPQAVAEHRSPFKPIDTNVPGMQFTELLKHTAKQADKLAVIRSMHHRISVSGHPDGTQYLLAGAARRTAGHARRRQRGGQRDWHAVRLPAAVHHGSRQQRAGLQRHQRVSFAGLQSVQDHGPRSVRSESGACPTCGYWTGLHRSGSATGEILLSRLNLGLVATTPGLPATAMDDFYGQAFDLLTNPKTQAAFDFKSEPDAVRDRYGRGHRGQCYLLGRRLIEQDVRFVIVDVREPETKNTPGGFNMNWDHHDFIYASGSCGTVRDKAGGEGRYGIAHHCMMGSTDQAFAALIEDMHQRGLLEETLVAFVTEFGRTPKLNKFQGRDHWTNAYSIAFAGAGVRGGQVIGRTDRDGGFVQDHPHTPDDYAATLYEFLGMDREQPIYTPDNRPIYLAKEGQFIEALL